MVRLSRKLRWAVVIARLDPAEGHEQAGTRRSLVVSYEPFHCSGLLTVCPITAARDVRYPHEVAVPEGEAGQTQPGVILCHQVRTISAKRITAAVGYLTDPDLRMEVRAALAEHLGLDLTPGEEAAAGTAAFA
jgi:mRNA interferase MazF